MDLALPGLFSYLFLVIETKHIKEQSSKSWFNSDSSYQIKEEMYSGGSFKNILAWILQLHIQIQ